MRHYVQLVDARRYGTSEIISAEVNSEYDYTTCDHCGRILDMNMQAGSREKYLPKAHTTSYFQLIANEFKDNGDPNDCVKQHLCPHCLGQAVDAHSDYSLIQCESVNGTVALNMDCVLHSESLAIVKVDTTDFKKDMDKTKSMAPGD